MTAHMKMDAPDRRRRLDAMAQGVIGAAMDRPDGPLKATGAAAYAADWRPEGLCYGVLARAPKAGRVEVTGAGAAKALPGVLAVITDRRMLRNPAQGTADEAPIQGCDIAAYPGQPVALVVAESFEAARHGAEALRIRVEPEKDHAIDPEAEGATVETPEDQQSRQGDLSRAMNDAAFTVDEIYRTPGHNSAAMEPHASIAMWDGDRLLLRGSYQMLKFNRNELADALGIEAENVRILAPYVGGGFGSKLGIAPEAVAAALAAKEVERPVSVTLSRRQVFEATMRRSETCQRVRLAADSSGRLTGIGHEALVSNLPGEAFSEPVTQATPFLYRGASREIGQRVARLGLTCAGSVRAPGEAVGMVALESAMDELAVISGIDPVELRKRNIPEKDPTGDVPFSSHKLAEALDEGARRFGWSARKADPGATREGEWLIGMGMASAARVNLLGESQARVTLMPDGSAVVETDMTDIGTGTYAVLTQIAAETLGLAPERVEVRLGDTESPPGAGSGGSWGAASSGSSVFLACEAIRKRIAARVGCEDGELTLKDGRAIHANEERSLVDLLDGETLSVEGRIEPGKNDEAVRQATYGAYFTEVGVNAVTGETRLRRMLGVFAAGRILNAKTARSQCLGGMTFGVGMALAEALIHDSRDGSIVNRDFAEYHLPVNADIPQLEVVLLEERDDWANPMQAKGIGELGVCGAAAAVTNAIYNACGVRVRDYPATLDKIIRGLPDA